MKNNVDLLVIDLAIIIEVFMKLAFKYSKYFDFIYFINEKTIIKNYESFISFSIAIFLLIIFYLLIFAYVICILYKLKKEIKINIKKNTFFLILLFIIDCILYFFNFKTMFLNSDALLFVINCLLTNLVVYIKYKKNNIKIK